MNGVPAGYVTPKRKKSNAILDEWRNKVEQQKGKK